MILNYLENELCSSSTVLLLHCRDCEHYVKVTKISLNIRQETQGTGRGLRLKPYCFLLCCANEMLTLAFKSAVHTGGFTVLSFFVSRHRWYVNTSMYTLKHV